VVGLIGADDRAWFEQRLAGYGVAFDGIRIGQGFTGTTISISTPHDRSFFTHIGVNTAVGALAMGEGLATLCAAAHVHFAMPLPREVAQVVLPLLAARGITTSLDMGYQPEWLASPANRATITGVDYLMPNERKPNCCSAAPTSAPISTMPRASASATRCSSWAPQRRALDNGEIIHVRPPVVQAVDATGAGDAFDAGFIDALLDAAPLRRRLERGCITGALSTRKPGRLAASPMHRSFGLSMTATMPSTTDRKLTLIGGGGVRTPLVTFGVNDAAQALGARELVLWDPDADRLAIMAALGRAIVRAEGGDLIVREATSIEDAVEGASFVMNSIRVGGIAGRAADERIAIQHGFPGQETTGPAGAAMALRTVPIAIEQARLVERHAPDAWIVNFTNPAGLITQAIANHTGARSWASATRPPNCSTTSPTRWVPRWPISNAITSASTTWAGCAASACMAKTCSTACWPTMPCSTSSIPPRCSTRP
jgi:sugar/nucleoside kinase (ribokinase family)